MDSNHTWSAAAQTATGRVSFAPGWNPGPEVEDLSETLWDALTGEAVGGPRAGEQERVTQTRNALALIDRAKAAFTGHEYDQFGAPKVDAADLVRGEAEVAVALLFHVVGEVNGDDLAGLSKASRAVAEQL